MTFDIVAEDGQARAGVIHCDHGDIPTPAFMPVGTQGTVKSLESREVRELGADIVLSNAYHLYLRPGLGILKQLGGLHKFMAWERPILVDSGGFQVLSLTDFRDVKEEGVRFRSHIDGSYHLFSPEKVIEIQRHIGADFVMPLDELIGWPCNEREANEAAQRTWRWLIRGIKAFQESEPLYGHEQTLVPIVQGAFFPELRKREAERLAGLNRPFYAIGGLAVGEEAGLRNEAIEIVNEILPKDRPKYAMGVGLPRDFLNSIARGVDIFDCVTPTRNGRNATLFTWNGRLNLRNAKYMDDDSPVEEGCPCPCCTAYSRAYLHHLYRAKEILAAKLGTAHNLSFFFRLLKAAREHIQAGDFATWSENVLEGLERERHERE